MSQLLSIIDDKIVINKLSLKYLEGSVVHSGQLAVLGAVTMDTGLTVNGPIRAKSILTENGSSLEPGIYRGKVSADVENTGLFWTAEQVNYKLTYQAGGNIVSNADFGVSANRSFKINNIPVLSSDKLGDSIVSSNLRRVGNLTNLTVNGNASISQFATFDSESGRLGVGTDLPNATLSVTENNVDVIIGAPTGFAKIGTYSSHDLALVSDNTARLTVKSNGEVHVGDEVSKTGVLRVYGTLYANNVISDTRLERSSPLEFKTTKDNSIYGMGLVWSGTGSTKQLIMMSETDRLWSSETIDLASGKNFSIGNSVVLTASSLGEGVQNSNLTSVGILRGLTVQGVTELLGNTVATDLSTSSFKVSSPSESLTFNSLGVSASRSFAVNLEGFSKLYIGRENIAIGSKVDPNKIVNVYGKLSVGVTNPQPDADLTVNGNIRFANKKFVTGADVPTEGAFAAGDICWNSNPQLGSYVGWICLVGGTPGQWAPFGGIGRQ